MTKAFSFVTEENTEKVQICQKEHTRKRVHNSETAVEKVPKQNFFPHVVSSVFPKFAPFIVLENVTIV